MKMPRWFQSKTWKDRIRNESSGAHRNAFGGMRRDVLIPHNFAREVTTMKVGGKTPR